MKRAVRTVLMMFVASLLFACMGEKLELQVKARMDGQPAAEAKVTVDNEVQGLTAGLLDVDSEPLGGSRLSEWVRAHRNNLGRRYASEMARRRDPRVSARSN